jgi:VWFA-related protein
MSNSASHKLLAALLISNLIGAPTPLVAQQSATDVPSLTLRANTRLVVLDVVVTDKKGQAITGLTADDFTVEENGKKQKVSVFLPPASTNRATPAAAPPGILSNRPENVGPSGVPIVLVLDATNSPFEQQAYARSEDAEIRG